MVERFRSRRVIGDMEAGDGLVDIRDIDGSAILVVQTTPREPESRLLAVIMLIYYLSAMLTLNWHLEQFTLWLPLGPVISWWYLVMKAPLNRTLKVYAVAFGAACFALRLMVPPIPLSALPALVTDTAVVGKFDQIRSVQVFAADSDVQQRIYDHVSEGKSPEIMLLAWIMQQQGIPLRDNLWLGD